jgi:hypothetical protein
MPDDSSDPDVTMARYEVDGPTGLRSQAIDCPVGEQDPLCPDMGAGAGGGGYTYGDLTKIRGGAEVHDDGEIWAQTLWDLRKRLIGVYGSAAGLTRARTLVTDALRLSPPNPTFLDMRNAILLADEQPGINGVDRSLIWDVFAKRGMGYAASTVDTDDVHPLQDFSHPPGTPAATGAVAGTVRDLNTGAPVVGALVAFAGHDSGLGEDLSTHTNASGVYRINGVPGPRVWSFLTVAEAGGYDRATLPNVLIQPGQLSTRNVTLRRNWALASGGTTVKSWIGPNFESYGCGPRSAIDGTRRSVWSTSAGAPTKEIVVTLPQPITVGEVRIDPSSGCGDSAAAALAGYVVRVSSNGTSFVTVAHGTFGPGNLGRANAVSLSSKPTGVRYVKLQALSTQGSSGFMDVAELQVFAPPPATVSPPPPVPPITPVAKLKLLTKRAKLSKRRRFAFRVSGPKAARVSTRFTVRVRRGGRTRTITFARASFRLSRSTGRVRVVVRVSRKTLRRIHARKLKVRVSARTTGQRVSSTLSLRRPKR